MNELLSNLSHLTSVVGTVFMVGVLLIAFAKMIYSELRHNRFIRQITVLQRNDRHYLVIRRCLWYGDRVPRKYRRAYGEVIRSLAGMENLREALGGPRV